MRINDFEITYNSGYYSYKEYIIVTKGDNIGDEKLSDFNQTHPSLKSFLRVLVDKGVDRVELTEICNSLVAEYKKKENKAWIKDKAQKVLAAEANKIKREMGDKL